MKKLIKIVITLLCYIAGVLVGIIVFAPMIFS